MILVILAIAIIFWISYAVYQKKEYNDLSWGCMGALPVVFVLIAVLMIGIKCSNLSVIDQKIEMYEKENTKIEQQIEALVIAYQKHEKEVFSNVKTDSYIQLVSLYPELRGDTLVEEHIKTYQSNNKQIKILKQQAIDGNVLRWWLYFGHKDVKY